MSEIPGQSCPPSNSRFVPTGDFAILARFSSRCDGRFDKGDAFGALGNALTSAAIPVCLGFPQARFP
jgi:hypothetical protein